LLKIKFEVPKGKIQNKEKIKTLHQYIEFTFKKQEKFVTKKKTAVEMH
jgi:hypothetical protein